MSQAEAAASIPRPDAPETLLAIGDQRSTVRARSKPQVESIINFYNHNKQIVSQVPTEPPGHREWCTENETLWREQNDLSTLQHHSADASRVAVIDKETRWMTLPHRSLPTPKAQRTNENALHPGHAGFVWRCCNVGMRPFFPLHASITHRQFATNKVKKLTRD